MPIREPYRKTFYLDRETTRRLDLVQLEPGYRDLTHCCHDSVEEGFVLGGEVRLDGEGVLTADDYFWRPPGWIHHAASPQGVELVLGFEGRSNESGPVSRYVCPRQDAGANMLIPAADERALGTRGRARRVESRLLVWQPGPDFARGEGALAGFDLERMAVRVLSRNPVTGQQTLLVRLAPGYRQGGAGAHSVRRQMFVLAGSLELGATEIRRVFFVHGPAGVIDGPLSSDAGALLDVKVDGRIGYTLG